MPFELQPTLEGRSLRLRPLRNEDFDALFAAASDPLIWEQHPASDRHQEEVFREYFREGIESGGAFVVIDKDSGEIIGSSRFLGYDEAVSEIEIGFTFLARPYWGGAFNREMKDLMLRHAFKFVRHVVFVVGEQNFRSQRAMEKIGGRRIQPRVDKKGRTNVVFQIDGPGSLEFLVRNAVIEDAALIAEHRAAMFEEMGELSPVIRDEFFAATRSWTESALARGEYVGWFAIPRRRPDTVAAGAGLQLRVVPPHPHRPPSDTGFAEGRHALVLNVYTDPEWRNNGAAFLLMEEVISWAKAEKLDRLVLHATAQARKLYERIGFAATNEMRFEV